MTTKDLTRQQSAKSLWQRNRHLSTVQLQAERAEINARLNATPFRARRAHIYAVLQEKALRPDVRASLENLAIQLVLEAISHDPVMECLFLREHEIEMIVQHEIEMIGQHRRLTSKKRQTRSADTDSLLTHHPSKYCWG